MTPAGWYQADGDPPGTQRYWDGQVWIGEPVAAPQATPAAQVPPAPLGTAAAAGPWASIGKRMGARVVDFIILIVFVCVLVALGLASSDAGGGAVSVSIDLGEQSLDSRLEFLLWGLFSFGWSTAWLAAVGATPGKALFGMKVVTSDLGAIDPKTAVLRSVNKLLPVLGIISVDAGEFGSMVLGFLLIGAPSLVMLFADRDKGNRTVMDRLAGTHVVNR